MKYKTKNEIVTYRIFVMNSDGKWKPYHAGCRKDLNWMEADMCIERLRTLKRGWIGKGEFPIRKIKLMEFKNELEMEITENMVCGTVEESKL